MSWNLAGVKMSIVLLFESVNHFMRTTVCLPPVLLGLLKLSQLIF